jgi:hypothetical protein
VLPRMNQSSSARMPLRNVRFVVSKGKVPSRREKRREGGAKMESVPVPVRSGRDSPRERTSRMRDRYCFSSCGGEFGVNEDDMAGGGQGKEEARRLARGEALSSSEN